MRKFPLLTIVVVIVMFIGTPLCYADPILTRMQIGTTVFYPNAVGDKIIGDIPLGGYDIHAEVHQNGDMVTFTNTTISCGNVEECGFFRIEYDWWGEGSGLHEFTFGGSGQFTGLGSTQIYFVVYNNHYAEYTHIPEQFFNPSAGTTNSDGSFSFGPFSDQLQLSTSSSLTGPYYASMRIITALTSPNSTLLFPSSLDVDVKNIESNPIPEPTAILLLGTGLGTLGLAAYRRKRK
ncbi:MAG: PEP-CTERM sorting domain-containing protein [Acidobacteria bacterium]|nr:PEP-CTERM sorting domain-containing protein [Acidobacteriota bacterium]